MKKPMLRLLYDAKNVVVELPPTKLPDPNIKDAPKLKRLAPRRPKQQPEEPPKKTGADD